MTRNKTNNASAFTLMRKASQGFTLMRKASQGFTLIELLVVIAIIGVMASFTILSFSGSQEKVRDTQRRSDMQQYATLLEVYANRHNTLYPTRDPTDGVYLTGSSIPIYRLCNALGISSNCLADPNYPATHPWGYNYTVTNDGRSYVLVGHLERAVDSRHGAVGPGHIFICSNGEIKEQTYDPDPPGSPDPPAGVCPS
jgi:general secretion pathway protein G